MFWGICGVVVMWVVSNVDLCDPPGASDPKTQPKRRDLQGTSESVHLKPRPKPTKSLFHTAIHVYTQTTHSYLIVMQFVTQGNEKYPHFRNGNIVTYFPKKKMEKRRKENRK